MPAPESIGLTLAPEHVAQVSAVDSGSLAAAAGLQVGDAITVMAGQRLISIADFSWALHRLPDTGAKLTVEVQRDGKTLPAMTVSLPDGWRASSVDNSQRVAAWPMRGMATGGMVLIDLSDEERQRRGLKADQMALFVKGLGQYGKHAAARKAGFMKDDVLVALDGKTGRITESELLGHLLRQRFPGEKVSATVLRNGSTVKLSLPMQ